MTSLKTLAGIVTATILTFNIHAQKDTNKVMHKFYNNNKKFNSTFSQPSKILIAPYSKNEELLYNTATNMLSVRKIITKKAQIIYGEERKLGIIYIKNKVNSFKTGDFNQDGYTDIVFKTNKGNCLFKGTKNYNFEKIPCIIK